MSATRPNRLLRAKRRTEVVRFPIVDDTTAAEQEVRSAAVELRNLKARPAEASDERRAAHEARVAMAEQRLAAAQAAYDECFDTVTLRALRPTVQQAFQHEEAEAQAAVMEAARTWAEAVKEAKEAGDSPPDAPAAPETNWSAESFEVRLIAACAVDGDTAEDWAEAFDDSDPDNPSPWTLERRVELLEACARVNAPRGSYDLGVLGKG